VKKEETKVVLEVPKAEPPIEGRVVAALEGIHHELQQLNSVMILLPEITVLGGLITYQGTNRTAEQVAKVARDYTENFFKELGDGDSHRG
jgi:hypothetical protein